MLQFDWHVQSLVEIEPNVTRWILQSIFRLVTRLGVKCSALLSLQIRSSQAKTTNELGISTITISPSAARFVVLLIDPAKLSTS